MMTRDEARSAFASSGLTYDVITPESLGALRKTIDAEMKKSGLMKASLRMRRAKKFNYLRCKGYYFEDREAVSFNSGGFIGFAGWADDQNVQPILSGFTKWVAALRETPEGGGER